jgi:phospholipid/cholesterol/gamma-HCH transport system ATP-binding protein
VPLTSEGDVVIAVSHLSTHFGSHVVHDDINFEVRRAEIFALIGGSGSGKSTLLRELILLHRPDAGKIQVLGADLKGIDDDATMALRRRMGVMFQHGGLFGSLTVLENIGLPMRERTKMEGGATDEKSIDEKAAAKLALAGLAPEVGALYPSALSGGMMKRASLARALSLDPELLFLDEPTAGLDPVSAGGVDTLVTQLRDSMGLTVVMITHDLDLLWQVADRVAVLADGKLQATGTMRELAAMDNPAVRPYFEGARGRAAQPQSNATDQPSHQNPGSSTSKPR